MHGGRGSVVRQAIRTLVHHPAIAGRAPGPDGLEGIDRPGIPLLIELLSELRENPCANTAGLLERWRNRPDLEHLSKLAATEYPVDAEGALSELTGALESLFPERRIQRQRELLGKNAREGLTDAERAELQGFLTIPGPGSDIARHRT
jgi:DNA primase